MKYLFNKNQGNVKQQKYKSAQIRKLKQITSFTLYYRISEFPYILKHILTEYEKGHLKTLDRI